METTFQGHKITVTENMEFSVEGPLFAGEAVHSRRFESASEARTAIEKRVKAREAQERVKLSFPMLNENGAAVTVTGVHGRNYNLLGVADSTSLYPSVPWIASMLREVAILKAQVRDRERTLGEHRVNPRQYGFHSHQEAIDGFTKLINQANEKAASKAVAA